jgi:hypothetical protein
VTYGTYFSQATILDFILEDESIGIRWLKPVQEDTALAGCLPGHLPWDIIRFSCRKGHMVTRPQVVPLFHVQTQTKLGDLGKLWNYGNWEGRRKQGLRLVGGRTTS